MCRFSPGASKCLLCQLELERHATYLKCYCPFQACTQSRQVPSLILKYIHAERPRAWRLIHWACRCQLGSPGPPGPAKTLRAYFRTCRVPPVSSPGATSQKQSAFQIEEGPVRRTRKMQQVTIRLQLGGLILVEKRIIRRRLACAHEKEPDPRDSHCSCMPAWLKEQLALAVAFRRGHPWPGRSKSPIPGLFKFPVDRHQHMQQQHQHH